MSAACKAGAKGRSRTGRVLSCCMLAVAVLTGLRASLSAFVGQAQVFRSHAANAGLTSRNAQDWKEQLKEAQREEMNPSKAKQAPAAGAGFGKGKQKKKISLEEALQRQRALQEADDKTRRDEAKLAPEEVFYEGPPSSTEVLLPFLACFAVIGIIPFIAAVNRQFRVKYIITDRRISVTGGFDGTDVTEFSYQEVKSMKYGLRWFGYCADLRIDLRDGAVVELFGLADFEENYKYIWERVEKDCRSSSDEPQF
mmetsp:Transcript_41258/g.94945  ORF Transcript_41258/g.94945 Transcript_41258/m.94945 type:complete len:254 (+) Transcript_41258:80-841(+)